jgi:hypothetical protein
MAVAALGLCAVIATGLIQLGTLYQLLDQVFQQAAATQTALVVGTPAVLRLGWGWPWQSDPVCADFWVQSDIDQPLPEVLVTSTGLGNATFAPMTGPLACTTTDPSETQLLRLTNVDRQGVHIRLKVMHSAFLDGVGGVDGRLRVYVPPQAPLDVPMRLESTYPSFGTVVTAMAWFLGIAIPILLTAGVGFVIQNARNSLDERRAQESAFKTYVTEHHGDLDNVFNKYLTNLATEDAKLFSSELKSKLMEFGLDQVPRGKRAVLEAALDAADRHRIKRELVKIYPHWRRQIMQVKDA